MAVGEENVISRLSIKISRMIGGDRKGSLFPKQFYWLAADQEKKRVNHNAAVFLCYDSNNANSKWVYF